MGKKKLYTEEYLLEVLRRETRKLGKTPSAKYFALSSILPSPSCYIYRWGSWNNAILAAGLRPNLKIDQKTTDEISLLKEKPRQYINLGIIRKEDRKRVKKIFIRGYKTIYYLEGDEVRAAKEFLIANSKKLAKRKMGDINKYNLPLEMANLIKRLYFQRIDQDLE